MKISLAEIEAIRADLAKLELPPTAVREMPIKEVIMTLAPELQGMVNRGYTTEGLLEVLKKRNISITGRSLNSYLREFKEGRVEVRKRGKKASASVDVASSSPTAGGVIVGGYGKSTGTLTEAFAGGNYRISLPKSSLWERGMQR